jgi:hypothetical protein
MTSTRPTAVEGTFSIYSLTFESTSLYDGHFIEGARAQLRAMLIEGAVSPKTTLLNDSFIEKLRQESKKRMGLA